MIEWSESTVMSYSRYYIRYTWCNGHLELSWIFLWHLLNCSLCYCGPAPHNMMCPGQKKNHFISIWIPFPCWHSNVCYNMRLYVHFTLNNIALSILPTHKFQFQYTPHSEPFSMRKHVFFVYSDNITVKSLICFILRIIRKHVYRYAVYAYWYILYLNLAIAIDLISTKLVRTTL